MRKPGSRLLAEIQHHFPNVRKVVDYVGKRKYFAVLETDCVKGKAENPLNCPTAVGLAREMGMPAMVRRWVSVLIDGKKNIAYRYMNDDRLAAAILNKDKTKFFQPGVYSVAAPRPRQKLGRRPPGPTQNPGTHKHKGSSPQPFRQFWSIPTAHIGPITNKEAV